MIIDLANRIWSRDQFKLEYERLVKASLLKAMGIDTESEDKVDLETLHRLLQSATAFSGTSVPSYREIAYRIAICSRILFSDEYSNINNIVHFILGRMGSFPTSNLLLEKSSEDFSVEDNTELPLSLWFEINSKMEENSVLVSESNLVLLTDFQKGLWEHLSGGLSVTMSAPTSSGKSYVLQNFLASKVINSNKYIAGYIVPTRALINQVSLSLSNIVSRLSDKPVTVSTVPIAPSEIKNNNIIYVLTQERLQILTEAATEVNFNIVIVDESQVISEESRGVILQSVIERILDKSKETQIMFASPLTKNPEIFPQTFELQDVKTIKEDESAVAQNFILLDTKETSPKEVYISSFTNDKILALGKKKFDVGLYESSSTLAYLSWYFGKNDKNLVYAGGQAACENIANKIYEITIQDDKYQDFKEDDSLSDFAQFLKEYIHPQYLLATTIRQGIAFHYGNMPAIVRKTIEDLFDEGKIRFLVCTSTLLHGVNLPAKNLFLLNPTKGRAWGAAQDTPISSSDFWNLAGRAGRMGKDFEGNVFLINLNSWDQNPLSGEKKKEVKPALAHHITENTNQLIEFIKDENQPSGTERQGLENTFTKLFTEFKKGDLDSRLDKFNEMLSNEAKESIIQTFSSINEKIKVQESILEKNSTVSPYRQQEMLDYLIHKINDEGPDRFIPIHPLVEWKFSYDSFWRMFKRIHSRFQDIPGRDKSNFYFAGLALRWMRGEHLSSLIDSTYKFRLKQQKRKPLIGTVIRQVMQSIEQDLRFRYVKYVNCYIDLLKQALEETENTEYLENIPPIPLFLELGASSKTMVSLIGLGLSRTTAKLLSDVAVNKDMDTQSTINWLKGLNMEGISLPNICLKEVKRIFG